MKWWEEHTECNKAKQPIKSPLPLGFNNMAGICAVLAVGIFLSLLLLLFEIKCRDLMKDSCMKGTNLPRKVTEYRLLFAGVCEELFVNSDDNEKMNNRDFLSQRITQVLLETYYFWRVHSDGMTSQVGREHDTAFFDDYVPNKSSENLYRFL